MTVFLTTQYLEEADRLADRIAVIDGGRIVAEGTPAELKQRVADQRLDLVLADAEAYASAASLARRPRARGATRAGSSSTSPTDGSAAHVRALLDEVDPGAARCARFALHSATLDDVFLALTGHTTARRTGDRRCLIAALTMAGRCIRLSMRNLDALLTSLLLPVMLMLLFVYVFGGAIETGTEYVTYVVPGVILLCAGFGSATTAVSVSQDMTGGIIDRLRSMDVGGPAVLAGHVVASVAAQRGLDRCSCSASRSLIGFRPARRAARLARRGRRAAGLRLAISWLAAALGLLAGRPRPPTASRSS